MKKLLFAIPIFLLLITNAFATSILVPDITKGNKITFTPGNNYFWGTHSCSYSWDISNVSRFRQFMEGASSYSYDTRIVGTRTRCINIKTDVADFTVDIPYVNQAAFKASSNPPKQNWSGVVFASSPEIGSPFRLSKNPTEVNTTLIEAGTQYTPDYFKCEVHNSDPLLKWLKIVGIDSVIAKGTVIDITFVTAHKHCVIRSLTFDPKLLKPPAVIVTPNPTPPVQPPTGCTPAI